MNGHADSHAPARAFVGEHSSAIEIDIATKSVLAGKTEPGIGGPGAGVRHGASKNLTAQIILIALGGVAFLYFARAVVLPLVAAIIAGMALKPIIKGLSRCHVPRALGAAVVLGLFVTMVSFGILYLGHPAVAWMNDASNHMVEVRQRVQTIFRPAARISEVAAAVNNLGTPEEQKKATPVEVRDGHGTSAFINWTWALLAGIGETLVLLFLLLSSGDMFLQKLVRILPSLHDKREAVKLSHEIQQNISTYLFSVSLINLGFGTAVGAGFFFLGVPNPAMWGMVAALLNYIPYFGPIAGIILAGVVGILSFNTIPGELEPALWYLLLHLLEANLVTPILLGRRFTLNPVVIFISLIFWTWLWGIPGALLSVPILIFFKAVCDRVPSLAPISEILVN
jgi:predicted PurR-regulated permease PerM